MPIHRNFLLAVIFIFFNVVANAKDYIITDFGAMSDTNKLSTAAIQQAIDVCSADGGGRVVVPAGMFKTGSLFFKSNVDFHLETGALLFGSRNLADYKSIKASFISLRTQVATIQLIYAENLHNTAITGYGEIDGQGDGFKLFRDDDEGIDRPHLIRFIKCTDILIENVSLKNAGCWMQHYLTCERLQIKGIKVFNRNNFNNDALDIDGCKNVTVSDCITDSDDDGIVLKSTSDYVCENVAISNCIISTHCNAIKLGTESNGGFKNITIANCVIKPSAQPEPVFYGSLKGVAAIALIVVDGGIMENVSITNIVVDGTDAPIFIKLGNRARPYKENMVIKNVGTITDISISNVQIINAGSYGCSITGLPGFPVNNIRLNNINMLQDGGVLQGNIHKTIPEKAANYPMSLMFDTLPAYGFYVRHATNISINGMIVNTTKDDMRPAFYLDDVQAAVMDNIQIKSNFLKEASVCIKNSQDVILQQNILKGNSHFFVKKIGNSNRDIKLLNNIISNGKLVNTDGKY